MENPTKNPSQIAKMDDLGIFHEINGVFHEINGIFHEINHITHIHLYHGLILETSILGPVVVPSGSEPQAKGWPAVRGIVEVILGLFGMFAQKC